MFLNNIYHEEVSIKNGEKEHPYFTPNLHYINLQMGLYGLDQL